MIPIHISELDPKRKRKSKYRSVRTTVDGIKFDSKREAARWSELRLLERVRDIHDLVRQPVFEFVLDGKVMFRYIGDFSYTRQTGEFVCEDVKGVRTQLYLLKKKLIEAQHHIKIIEV